MEASQALILRRLDAVGVLKRLPRTGWLVAGVVHPESVAEHSFAVAHLALALAEAINRDLLGQGLAAPLDVGRVAQIALVHDLAESAITDLPHGATRYLGKAVKDRAEEAALRDLVGESGTQLLTLWRAYADQDGPEAKVVRDADKLEMVHQALSYAQAGHRGLGEFWDGHEWHYPLSAELFLSLAAQRPQA